MVKRLYSPKQGDLVWITLDPAVGNEQKGRRPAVVLSRSEYNKKIGLALFCPVTSKTKGYPFEVAIKTRTVSGFVLTDHIKSLSWRSRNVDLIQTLDPDTFEKILNRAKKLFSE